MTRNHGLIVLAFATLAGCGGSTSSDLPTVPVAPQPTSIDPVGDLSGSLLIGTAAPIAVHAHGSNGASLAGVTVSFAATGGTLSAATATTDASGIATVQWTAPASPITATVTASVTGTELKATFTENAYIQISGNYTGTTLGNSFTLALTHNAPVSQSVTGLGTLAIVLSPTTFAVSGSVNGADVILGFVGFGITFTGKATTAPLALVGVLNGGSFTNAPITFTKQ